MKKKPHHRVALALALLVAACGQPSTTPGLTGAMRASFVSSAIGTCSHDMQAQLAGNPNFAPAKIRDYCTCSADKMADMISEAEMVEIGTDEARATTAMQSRIDTAAKACALSVFNTRI